MREPTGANGGGRGERRLILVVEVAAAAEGMVGKKKALEMGSGCAGGAVAFGVAT